MVKKVNKKQKIEKTIIEPEIVVEEKNINLETTEEEKIVVEPKTKSTEKKIVCRVVLATPTYYVINKKGVNVTINEKNNYRRGDEILK